MNKATRPPVLVRHRWKFHSKYVFPDGSLLRNIWRCSHCKLWTNNMPAYKYDVCEGRDRRANKPDRRQT